MGDNKEKHRYSIATNISNAARILGFEHEEDLDCDVIDPSKDYTLERIRNDTQVLVMQAKARVHDTESRNREYESKIAELKREKRSLEARYSKAVDDLLAQVSSARDEHAALLECRDADKVWMDETLRLDAEVPEEVLDEKGF